MNLNQNNRVVFNEMLHEYLLDDEKVLIGVTSLMKKHGLSPDYSGIDEATLRHAAELGSAAHKAIEDYCEGNAVDNIPLIESFKKLKLNVIACEYLVSDNKNVASSIDITAAGENDNEVILVDMKRTSSVHKDALSWQLGIYKHFFEMANPELKVVACYCLPIKKGNKDDILKDTCEPLVPIEPVDSDRVEALLVAEEYGYIYTEQANDAIEEINPDILMTYEQNAEKVMELKLKLKEYEDAVASIEQEIYNFMLSSNTDVLYTSSGEIRLKKPFLRTSFDSKRFKAEWPDMFTKYSSQTEIKGSISFKKL